MAMLPIYLGFHFPFNLFYFCFVLILKTFVLHLQLKY